MPQPETLLKAQFQRIKWDKNQRTELVGDPVPVQFNPETLKVSYSNQKAGGDQRGGSAIQFVGAGTTKLSFDLWFDVTAAPVDQGPGQSGQSQPVTDVRRLTKQINDFIVPEETGNKDKFLPKAVRFLWGTFLFDGIMESMNESLEFFSEDGKPLRASVSVTLTQQEIQFEFGNQTAPGLGSQALPGTAPLEQTRAGDTLQDVSARSARQDDWQTIAEQNDIENPRHLPPGSLINV